MQGNLLSKDSKIDHQAHYNRGGIDFIEDQELGFHLGNVVTYLARSGSKPGCDRIEDLKKAAWYLNRIIRKLEKETGNLTMKGGDAMD